jgi:hypothetical protein
LRRCYQQALADFPHLDFEYDKGAALSAANIAGTEVVAVSIRPAAITQGDGREIMIRT